MPKRANPESPALRCSQRATACCMYCEWWTEREIEDLKCECTHPANKPKDRGVVYASAPLAICDHWEPNEAWYRRGEDVENVQMRRGDE